MTKKKTKKKFKILSMLKILILLIIIVGLLGAGATLYIVKNIIDNAPNIDPTKFADSWTENAEILDINGELIEKLQDGGYRTIIKYSDISPVLIDTYVSVEDKTFWEHSGFNYVRLVGAVWEAITSGSRVSGTSTITQQTARNLYLTDKMTEYSLSRKIEEAYYSVLIERHLSKEQILEAYLNTIYLGSRVKGIQAASEIYFSKNANDLDYIESAILAGIPKSPAAYSPMKYLVKDDVSESDIIINDADPIYTAVYNKSSHDRYLTVLNIMHGNNVITDSEYEIAKNTNIYDKLVPGKIKDTDISSYFSDMVKNDVIDDLMETYDYSKDEATNYLYNAGLTIYSTMDLELQKIVENTYNEKDFSTYFGDSTYSSVRNFQSRYAIQVDGIVGTGTWSKLLELGAVLEEDIPDITLRKGMTDYSVVILKEALNKMGLLNNNESFPQVTVYFDSDKNIINKDTKKITLYKYQNIVNEDEQFIIKDDEYSYDSDGNLILYKNNALNFYSHYVNNELSYIQLILKDTFTYDEDDQSITINYGRTEQLTPEQIEAGIKPTNKMTNYNIPNIFIYQGHDLLIPDEYKSYDDKKNVVISKDFFENSDFMEVDENNNLLISKKYYVIDEKGVIQPQASFVLIDYRSGELRALVGGRNITGQKIYNRAINPRQPGSAIKPLAVYIPAIDSRRWTSGTVVDDIPTYLGSDPTTRWPLNWYETGTTNPNTFKYWGLMTVRDGIKYSLNVVSAIIANDIGPRVSIEYLKNMGITSLVETGAYNDINLSSMALGGMTQGISPLEMTEAYGTIANSGVHSKTITYTKVVDNLGNVILENKSQKNVVVDEQVAYIVGNLMESGVTSGIAKSAAITPNNEGIVVAGKTGTTSNKIDAWFVGFTPYYVASVWFGNDINVPLNQGSSVSAEFWSKLMSKIHEGYADKEFIRPDGILDVRIDSQSGKLPTDLSYLDPRGSTVITELYLPGTQPTTFDDSHIIATIDIESGQLATENCPTSQLEKRVFVQRLTYYNPEEHLDKYLNPILTKDHEYILPDKLCELHAYTIYSIIDIDFINSTKFIVFPDGTVFVNEPVYITLKDGNKLLLQYATRINRDLSILLLDGTVLTQDQYYIKSIDKPDFIPPIDTIE